VDGEFRFRFFLRMVYLFGMVMMQERPVRPLRADARRNRELIITAADELFRVEGAAVQMDAVAHRAGLGVGTLYRHFPTKEALLVELVIHRFEASLAEAEEALAESDSGVAMRRFVAGIVKIMTEDAGLQTALTNGDPDQCAFYRDELMERKRALVSRAQADGMVRADLTLDDFSALMCGLGASIQAGGTPQLVIDILLDGMHVPAACTGG
jgi:AcrR family transcriptional regulator